jgi:hypothetical protein
MFVTTCRQSMSSYLSVKFMVWRGVETVDGRRIMEELFVSNEAGTELHVMQGRSWWKARTSSPVGRPGPAFWVDGVRCRTISPSLSAQVEAIVDHEFAPEAFPRLRLLAGLRLLEVAIGVI